MVRTAEQTPTEASKAASPHDRSIGSLIWYRFVQCVVSVLFSAFFGLRATGRKNLPKTGAALLVSNHLSHLDSFVLGILLHRPLNYVARSTLFVPGVGAFIRSLGGFPIQREGLGASGMKETLRRLRAGGIVTLFPEGTRTHDGELGEIKAGISLLATRAKVPVVPAAIAGTYESWPRSRTFPASHPLRVHFGPPIYPADVVGLDPETVTQLIRDRLLACQRAARAGLAGDMGEREGGEGIAVGGSAAMG
jgi:1-acyl-sn-glycerol-3-phosphate acyltransferase